MFPYDPAHRFETQPGSLPHSLGGEERLENMVLHFRRDARSIVGDFDQQAIDLARRADTQLALSLHGVDGVVDQVGPDLVQVAAARADLRQGAVEIELHRDAVFQPVTEHQQRAFEALVDVHFLIGPLVHVGVLFNRRTRSEMRPLEFSI